MQTSHQAVLPLNIWQRTGTFIWQHPALTGIAPFLFLVALWSTTPVVIKLSIGEGVDFSLAVFARFLIAAIWAFGWVCLSRDRSLSNPRLWHLSSIQGVISGISFLCAYWAMQHISAALGAILLGLGPTLTALQSRWLLGERLSQREWSGILLGIFGTVVIFWVNLDLGTQSMMAIIAGMASMALNSLRSVLFKRFAGDFSASAVSNVANMASALFAGICWLGMGMPMPEQMPGMVTLAANVYLALVGTVLAFVVLLKLIGSHRPTLVSLIFAITPLAGMWLGHLVNHEVISGRLAVGSAICFSGLLIFLFAQWQKNRKAG